MGVKFFYLTAISILLSGCFTQNEQIIVPQSTQIIKQTNTIDYKKDESNIQEKNKKKQQKCEEYTKKMKYAEKYIVTEFEKGYFVHKDIVGAKAQLFLIRNDAQNIFAKNINDAEKSYVEHYTLAKKLKCDLRRFPISPITKIKNTIKVLDDEASL